jgi:pyridoxamine 5'-phosphate oxidase
VRTVLLRGADERGFVFYTNKRSRKGHDIDVHPQAALCLFWQPLMEQVMIEGTVEDVDDAQADTYWAGRPRESQIGAWASLQSEPLDDRAILEARVQEFAAKFADQPVPRPPYWGGYRVVPDMIEFWNSRAGRLHERDRYFLEDGTWRYTLLNP